MSHLPSASLGHYAPLSYVVIGRRHGLEVRDQKSEVGGQMTDDRGQMHPSSRFQVPSFKFQVQSEDKLWAEILRIANNG